MLLSGRNKHGDSTSTDELGHTLLCYFFNTVPAYCEEIPMRRFRPQSTMLTRCDLADFIPLWRIVTAYHNRVEVSSQPRSHLPQDSKMIVNVDVGKEQLLSFLPALLGRICFPNRY
ncbi:jg13080 [Pararge aegeria aegeria]|uniref:Jg13080 protein n=1 Tax=Pararge aegeria aegeria TaxID=348720 RepID=A0A8S4RQJ8_9NEOP|nr:jg13080 [Pararge aegeria aegeria]